MGARNLLLSAKNVLVYLKVPASKVLAKNESVPHGKALHCKAGYLVCPPVPLMLFRNTGRNKANFNSKSKK